MVQAALVSNMRLQNHIDLGCILDLGSERCWVLVITSIVALAIATMMAKVASTFSLKLCT